MRQKTNCAQVNGELNLLEHVHQCFQNYSGEKEIKRENNVKVFLYFCTPKEKIFVKVLETPLGNRSFFASVHRNRALSMFIFPELQGLGILVFKSQYSDMDRGSGDSFVIWHCASYARKLCLCPVSCDFHN